MDISRAGTEAYVRYHFFREAFHTMIASTAAAHTLLHSVVGCSNGPDLLGSLIDSAGEPWGRKKRILDPQRTVHDAAALHSNLLIVQTLSAFDAFTRNLLVDLSEFAPPSSVPSGLHHQHTAFWDLTPARRAGCCSNQAHLFTSTNGLDTRIEGMSSLFAHLPQQLSGLLPLFHYFRQARNRIVHSNAYPGDGFDAYANSPELLASVTLWNSCFANRPAPPLPLIEPQQQLRCLPRHAVLCSTVCYEFAQELDRKASGLLGQSGFTRMALYYSLVAPSHPFRARSHRLAEAPVANFLSNRYRVRNCKRDSIRSSLVASSLWDLAKAKHAAMYLA